MSLARSPEHVVALPAMARQELIEWLQSPLGGSFIPQCYGGRVCFEAIESGGILVRTRGYGEYDG